LWVRWYTVLRWDGILNVHKGETMKQVAILEGGDWADAGVHHFALSDDANLKELHKEYKDLCKTTWRTQGKFITFPTWLEEEKGAQESSVEEFWDE
jgi:hypothetical protein